MKIYNVVPVAYENMEVFEKVQLKFEPQLESFVLPVCIKVIHIGTDNYFNVCTKGNKVVFTFKHDGMMEFQNIEHANIIMNELKIEFGEKWCFEIWSVNAVITNEDNNIKPKNKRCDKYMTERLSVDKAKPLDFDQYTND